MEPGSLAYKINEFVFHNLLSLKHWREFEQMQEDAAKWREYAFYIGKMTAKEVEQAVGLWVLGVCLKCESCGKYAKDVQQRLDTFEDDVNDRKAYYVMCDKCHHDSEMSI